MTLDQFKCIIRNMRAVDSQYTIAAPEDEAQFYINLLEPVISILANDLFGETNANIVSDFILGESKFETVEQLYDFISDKYSKLVSFNAALTLPQLRDLFPDEAMFKVFESQTHKIC